MFVSTSVNYAVVYVIYTLACFLLYILELLTFYLLPFSFYHLNEDPAPVRVKRKVFAAKAKKPCLRSYSPTRAAFTSATLRISGSKCWPSAPKTPRRVSWNIWPNSNLLRSARAQ